MIGRIIDALVMLGGGLIVGWLLVSPPAPSAPERASSASHTTVVTAAADPGPEPPAVALGNCPKPEPRPEFAAPGGNMPLPAAYAEMIGSAATGVPGAGR